VTIGVSSLMPWSEPAAITTCWSNSPDQEMIRVFTGE
jgi:hypothetical protein